MALPTVTTDNVLLPKGNTITLSGDDSAVENVSDLSRYGNPALKATADHQISLNEAPIEEPGPGQVLLHIKATGICG